MLERLRKRFMALALVALTLAMLLVTAGINLINWLNVRAELEETISYLAANGGRITVESATQWAGKSRHKRNVLSESSYFVGTLTGGAVSFAAEIAQDTSITREEAADLVARAAASGRESGFLGDYLYAATSVGRGGTSYVFLNCETRLSSVRRLLIFSGAACVGGVVLAMVAVALFSRRAIRPMEENERRQKQFITDASHELKTPLTVIAANMDVLSLQDGDNPYIQSTIKQTAAMRGLVEELVYLSRMEEQGRPAGMETLNLSALVEEQAEPFAAMAEFQGKALQLEIAPQLAVQGEREALGRLVAILCDNAVKYAEGKIVLRCRREGRHTVLETINRPQAPMTAEQCAHLFDRFYRGDASRSKEKSGYGLGLAIASAIAARHEGTMTAQLDAEGRLILRFTMPASAPAKENTVGV